MRDSTTFGSSAEASLVPGAVILLGLDESAKRYVRLAPGRVVANDDAGSAQQVMAIASVGGVC